MITGAESVARALTRAGVALTFGMPGAHTLDLVDALAAEGIRNVLVTSELSSSFMADGYARVAGVPGVCISIPGPGLTNMITGLAEAKLDSSPMVVIVTGIEEDSHSFHLHEIDQLAAVRPAVKTIVAVKKAGEIADAVGKALAIAGQGEPGPVIVEIPRALLREKTKDSKEERLAEPEELENNPEKTNQIVDLLRNATHCGIYAGKGAFGAFREVLELAEKLHAPVATTVSGKGVVPEDHELSLGYGFGPTGESIAEQSLKKCDVLLALGCKFSEMSTGKWSMEIPGKLIHIDKSKEVLDKNYRADIALHQDIQVALLDILKALRGVSHSETAAQTEKTAKKDKLRTAKSRNVTTKIGIHPTRFLTALSKAAPDDTIFVTDCGNHQLFTISDLEIKKPRSFLTPSDYQAMGFGIPAAIGAGLAAPNAKIVCILGDGGLLLTGFELLTAQRENINLAAIVFNDGALGLIKDIQKKIYGRVTAVELTDVKYRQLAGAFGLKYLEIVTEADIAPVLEKLRQTRDPVLVNVHVEYKDWAKYMKGVALSSWKRLSTTEKLATVARRAKRFLDSKI